MERRTVRIYKAPNGQGEYINKTAKFLKKAQMGAETEGGNDKLEPIVQFVTGALADDMQPEEVMKILVSKGLPKELVYSIISSVLQEQEAPEEEESADKQEENQEESKIGQSEYQPVGKEEQVEEEQEQGMDYFNSYADEDEGSGVMDEEYEEGGPVLSYDDLGGTAEEGFEMNPELIEKLSALRNFTEQVSDDDFKDFGKDISEYQSNYTPVEWDMLGDGYGSYKKGGSKKNFTKNVLALIKKAEGGDTQEIGKGNKKDTLTNEVSKRKSSFTDKLKEVSTKAAVDSVYEKMMKSNNPELIQSAQELAASRKKNSQMGTFEPVEGAQIGGYVGEGQPNMFTYGGVDQMPEAQKGMIQKLGDFLLGEQYYTANNPYNVKTGSLYKDPVSGLTPVARTVHKRGILGRPKQWTDYYTKGSSKTENTKALTPGQEIKADYEKQLADAKNKDTGEKHGMSKELWNSLPGEAKRDIRRGERRLNRELERGIEQEEKDILFNKGVHQYIDLDAEAAKEKLLQEARQKKLLEKNRERSEALSIEMGMHKPDWWNQVSVAPTLPEGLTLEDIEYLDAEKENADMLSTSEQQKAAEERLKLYKQDSRSNDNSVAKIKENAYDQFKNLIHFIPDNSMADYKEKRDREAEERRLVEERIMGQEFEKRYGGLPKAQVGVKSPTSGVSTASDPTANSGNLVGMLKPQENPNTFMGASKPFMNQNVPTNPEAAKVQTIEMDPNQTKDQPENDELIAQDVQRKRNIDGTDVVNKVNAGIDMFTGFMGRLDAAKKEKEMYENNFTSDNLYGVSTNKDRGDYVAYGQQTGMFRPDQTGQETAGRFAYGQVGGYMQSGGYTEGDEVDMTEEELADFIANGGEVEYL